jgi:C-terminal processing protease CtpA/Prc
MMVTANLNRRDSIFKRGTIIRAINDRPIKEINDTLFKYISSDGFNQTHKFQSISNRGFFGSLYTWLFGLSNRYKIDYTDSAGNNLTGTVAVFDQVADTIGRRTQPIRLPPPGERRPRRETRKRALSSVRQLRIDSVNHTAFMELNSFGRGYGLKGFFRRSFRYLRKNDIGHLIIDIRSNGGGSVTNSTFLTRFLADQKFKVADSLYAIKKKATYNRYIQNDFFNRLFITLFTKKRSGGRYHFGYFERHYFKPKRKNHFTGKTYILTGGNSFSASTLFATALMAQDDVTIVGEETGGAAYGNTAWLIPDVTLPNTKVRFRLPLFRLVIDKNIPKDGKGVQPEVLSFPTIEDVRRGSDFKLEKTLELIELDKKKLY